MGKGVHLKRTSMHGRGRSGQRLRYRSHLTVGCGGVQQCLAAVVAAFWGWSLLRFLLRCLAGPVQFLVCSCNAVLRLNHFSAVSQVVLREEMQEPRRHTKILPMLAEREKWQRATAPGGAAAAAARPEP